MFFSVQLLNLQKGGKFAKIWIAATRGAHALSNRDVLQIDLEKTAEDLRLYIISSSAKPRDRFSLVLSSKLIFGLARLYKKKTCLYLDEVFHFLCKIRRPAPLLPPTPVSQEISKSEKRSCKVVAKKQPKESSTPDIIVSITPVEATNGEITDRDLEAALQVSQEQMESLTLRETDLVPLQSEKDAFGPLSGLADADFAEQPSRPAAPPSSVLAPPHGPSTSSSLPGVPDISQEKKRATSELGSPAKRRAISVETEKRVMPEVVVEEARAAEPEFRQSAQVQEDRRDGDGSVAGGQRGRPKQQLELLVEYNYDIKRIYRKDDTAILAEIQVPYILHVTTDNNPYVLQVLNERYGEDVELMAREMGLDKRTKDSLSLGMSALRARSSSFQPRVSAQIKRGSSLKEQSSLPVVEVAVQKQRPETSDQPAAQLTVEYGEIPYQKEEELILAVQAPQKEVVKQRKSKAKQDTVDVLKHNLREWKWDHRAPTIEDICPKPLNKLNVSVTFTTLLGLDKAGFVLLIGDPETLELQYIEKGLKFC